MMSVDLDFLRTRLLLAAVFLLSCCLGCQSLQPLQPLPVEEKKIRTIAVWDLENLNQTESGAVDLGELFSARIIEALVESGKWKVVERQQLIVALEELSLGSTSMVSESTRLKIGKIVGAHYMVFGHYLQMMQVMQINLRLVDVETGRVVRSAERNTVEEDIGIWQELAKAAANDLQF